MMNDEDVRSTSSCSHCQGNPLTLSLHATLPMNSQIIFGGNRDPICPYLALIEINLFWAPCCSSLQSRQMRGSGGRWLVILLPPLCLSKFPTQQQVLPCVPFFLRFRHPSSSSVPWLRCLLARRGLGRGLARRGIGRRRSTRGDFGQ